MTQPGIQDGAWIGDPTGVFVYLAALLGAVYALSGLRPVAKLFEFAPAILWAYFLPMVSTTLGIIPVESAAYDWIVRHLLLVALVLLMVTVDLPAVVKLGRPALIMMLTGTLGIVLGGPLALAVFGRGLPPDAWKGMAALSGSWIGGSAQLVAVAESVGTPDAMLGPIIVVDTLVGYGWMGILLFLSAYQTRFDRWNRADTRLIEETNAALAAKYAEIQRPITVRDLSMILAVGFVGAYLCRWAGERLPELGDPQIVSHTTWAVVLVTTVALGLSFTPLSRLEGPGASRVGTVALYLLVTAIGARGDLRAIAEAPLFLAAGALWIAAHVALLIVVARRIRAPLFFVATGSMANVGGAASAPVVAGVYHPAMAPVGVLMAVVGYVIGLYGGLACAWLLSQVSVHLL
ncbi:MAG TPA: DUF819 family protein [Gemmatimonadota bacterium]|nr:DUF819 family protein [Gemmatimonadota bacterium]